MSDDVSELVSMLSDETSLEVGISGDIELEGRIYHWRLERRCPRVAAIRALFQIGVIPEGGRMLKAMLAEATHAAVICARLAVPHRFSVDEWRSAVNVARGLSVADPMIRAARQRCRDLARSGLDSDGRASAALSELDTIVNRLSGRSRAVTV